MGAWFYGSKPVRGKRPLAINVANQARILVIYILATSLLESESNNDEGFSIHDIKLSSPETEGSRIPKGKKLPPSAINSDGRNYGN